MGQGRSSIQKSMSLIFVISDHSTLLEEREINSICKLLVKFIECWLEGQKEGQARQELASNIKEG